MAKPKTKRTPDETPATTGGRVPETPAPKPGRPGERVEEIGGRDGPDPTRYGDYEKDGRCVDF